MTHKLARHFLAIVELAAVHERADVLLFIDVEGIRIRPPRGRDDALDNPGEGFRAVGLS
jgi:hypothetical protein